MRHSAQMRSYRQRQASKSHRTARNSKCGKKKTSRQTDKGRTFTPAEIRKYCEERGVSCAV